MTDPLTRLLLPCKCEVSLTVNEHRCYYQTVDERVEELIKDDE